MVSASKIATGSSLVAVPAVVATGAVYKDELFETFSSEQGVFAGSTKTQEEDTYWRFFYFLLKNYLEDISAGTSLNVDLTDWRKLKEKCRNWNNENFKSFIDVASENCAVITAFANSSNGDWGKYLGYFNKFKNEGWGTKEIDYSGNNGSSEESYKTLYSSFKTSSTQVTESSMAKAINWNPSSITR